MSATAQLAAELSTKVGHEVRLGFTSPRLGTKDRLCQFSGRLVAVDAIAITIESPSGDEDQIALATLAKRGCFVTPIVRGVLADTTVLA